MKDLKMKKILVIVPCLVVVFMAVVNGIQSRTEKRDRYLIPEDFEGWVCIDYLISGAEPFPIEDGFKLIKITSDGMASTSSMLEKSGDGFRDEYIFYDLATQQRKATPVQIGGGATSGEFDQLQDKYKTFRSYFWVGRVEKNNQWMKVHGGDIACGPIKELASD